MRRILTALAAVPLVLVLAACSGTAGDSDADDPGDGIVTVGTTTGDDVRNDDDGGDADPSDDDSGDTDDDTPGGGGESDDAADRAADRADAARRAAEDRQQEAEEARARAADRAERAARARGNDVGADDDTDSDADDPARGLRQGAQLELEFERDLSDPDGPGR